MGVTPRNDYMEMMPVIDAINTRDSEIVLSETLVVALVTVISLLIADILYAVADPRISYS